MCIYASYIWKSIFSKYNISTILLESNKLVIHLGVNTSWIKSQSYTESTDICLKFDKKSLFT